MGLNVELVRIPTAEDKLWCKQCAIGTMRRTSDKPPTAEWLHSILEARHSPIRELRFGFVLTVPYWVSVHLVRHHVGFQAYVQSQRNDRQSDYDRNTAPQDAPVTMRISLNAEALMTLANKRLCMKASPETREVVRRMCAAVEEACPEFRGLLVPMCEYHNGKCHEMQSCGRCDK
jgi:hypothetical protein